MPAWASSPGSSADPPPGHLAVSVPRGALKFTPAGQGTEVWSLGVLLEEAVEGIVDGSPGGQRKRQTPSAS